MRPPKSQALSTQKNEKASDLRKHCARGGTRTTFQPLQTLGTRENMRNKGQSEGCLAQYEAKSVDIVHTHFRGAETTGAPDAWKSRRQRWPG
jgi:hypothetical protein